FNRDGHQQQIAKHQRQFVVRAIPADPLILGVMKQHVSVNMLLRNRFAVDLNPAIAFIERLEKTGEMVWSWLELGLRLWFQFAETFQERNSVNGLLRDHREIGTTPKLFTDLLSPVHVIDLLRCGKERFGLVILDCVNPGPDIYQWDS